ncbi:hypothetical protein C0J52_26283 [Blattella germanica]|nr:hypothetical protein C0J52_26283 [Blattella germanica]
MSALGVEAEGTKEWLQIMRNWWLIVNVKHPEKGKRLREEFAKPIRCMDQENVKYLQIFCNWLKNWNDIVILYSPRGCGKLSRETYGALLHSTETLVKLCEYLLNVKKFQYVMLGVFQTDELEKRFSRYRIMSGCNYNVSVQQIIESERKLKVTSLLKLRSRSSVSLNVSEVIADINASTENIVTVDCFEEFDTIMAACSEIEIDDSTLEVIIFIAGYVSFKVCYKTSCLMCKQLLIIDHELDFDVPSELNYFNNLNRGGLKYPSAISTDIGINRNTYCHIKAQEVSIGLTCYIHILNDNYSDNNSVAVFYFGRTCAFIDIGTSDLLHDKRSSLYTITFDLNLGRELSLFKGNWKYVLILQKRAVKIIDGVSSRCHSRPLFIKYSNWKYVLILQKRAVKIIDGVSSRCHSRPLFIKYSILTLPSMYVLSCLLYAKNNLGNFATNGDYHDHKTRNRNNLQIRKNKYTVIKNSFHSIFIKLFNSLPSVVKHLPAISGQNSGLH